MLFQLVLTRVTFHRSEWSDTSPSILLWQAEKGKGKCEFRIAKFELQANSQFEIRISNFAIQNSRFPCFLFHFTFRNSQFEIRNSPVSFSISHFEIRNSQFEIPLFPFPFRISKFAFPFLGVECCQPSANWRREL